MKKIVFSIVITLVGVFLFLGSVKEVNAQACSTHLVCNSTGSACTATPCFGGPTACCWEMRCACSACGEGYGTDFPPTPGIMYCMVASDTGIGVCEYGCSIGPTPTLPPSLTATPTPPPGGCVNCGTLCGEGQGQGGPVNVTWEDTSICNCGLSCAGWQAADGACDGNEPCFRVCWGATCGGGGGDPTARVVGRVIDTYTGPTRFWQPLNDDTNSPDPDCGASYPTDPNGEDPDDGVGLRIENSGGGDADWSCNPQPFYTRRASNSGNGPHTFVLTPPTGSSCSDVSWTIHYPLGYSHSSFASSNCSQLSDGTWLCAGTGCSATVYTGYDDWDNHLTWRINSSGTCTVGIPPVTINGVGQLSSPITASVNTFSGGTIQNVEFDVTNTSIASLNPAYVNPDTTSPYQTQLRGEGLGSTTYSAVCRVAGNSNFDIETNAVNVTNSLPWWQAHEGDVVAAWPSGGTIFSGIPQSCVNDPVSCPNPYLISNSTNSPGIAVASSQVGVGAYADVSDTEWEVEFSQYGGTIFDYDYFRNKISPANVPALLSGSTVTQTNLTSGGRLIDGYYVYRYNGGLGLNLNDSDSSIDLGNRKVVLFVDSGVDVTIRDQIHFGPNGYFALFTEGNIFVDPNVGGAAAEDIEGLFVAGGFFDSGTLGNDADSQLELRGTIYANSFRLRRDLGGATGNSYTPAERFIYAPDVMMNFPKFLAPTSLRWKEVAP